MAKKEHADIMSFNVPVKRNREKTIILGYEIGHADLPDGRALTITGSGKILRVAIFGDGERKEYDIDLNVLVEKIYDEERNHGF